MATEVTTAPQGVTEIRTHYVDFTADLPTGVTISSAAATHSPPSGAASTPTVGTPLTGDIVPVTFGPVSVTGRHVLSVLATLSNGDKSEVRLIVPVEWEAARAGLVDLIADLRGMTNAGSNDYSVGGAPYWTDKQLEAALDRARTDHYRVLLDRRQSYSGGTVQYRNYYLPMGNIEKTTGGTAIFYLEDAAGQVVGTALYSVDYRTGHVSFGADTGGSAYYWYGRSYDLNSAAADVWRQKGAHYATQFDFSTDNHSVKRSAVAKQCMDMARHYDQMRSTPNTVDLYRGDM